LSVCEMGEPCFVDDQAGLCHPLLQLCSMRGLEEF
jgi:hypothetical protein